MEYTCVFLYDDTNAHGTGFKCCDACGALVGNTDVHDNWHEYLKLAVSAASVGLPVR